MSMRRMFTIGLVSLISILLCVELVALFKDMRSLRREYGTMQEKLQNVQKENQNLMQDKTYYQNPDNMEKMLREKFNYKEPGEKMIIIIPQP